MSLSLPQVHPGDRITVQSLTGPLVRIATSEVVPGERFLVVWACPENEWASAQLENRDPDTVPWPVEDVQVEA